jgi:peptidoglycan/LPS O-acetylase OafA/YrhL
MQRQGRLTELDAMRGIAAFAVVMAHAIYNLPGSLDMPAVRILSATPLRPLIDGRQAVIFFFVLSGLVLTRALSTNPPPGFAAYALRRAIRLCLPAAAAVLLSALLYIILYTAEAGPDPTGWLRIGGWNRMPSPAEVLRQTLLIGADGDFYLDHVLWTLVHELRFSLLLPLVIAFTAKRDQRGGMLLLMAGGMLFGLDLGDHLISANGFGGKTGSAMPHVLTYVALPAAIFVWIAARTSLASTLSLSSGGTTAMRWLCLVMGAGTGILLGSYIGDSGHIMLGDNVFVSFLATFYYAPSFLAGVAVSLGALEGFAQRPRDRVICVAGALVLLSYDNVFATVVAAVLLIQVALQPGRLRTLLRTAPLLFLGRVSFSLYLIHLPLLLALSFGLHAVLPGLAINALWLVLSVPSAWALYRVAELPAQRLARAVGRSSKIALA